MKVRLFRSTMNAWLQNHAQFSYISFNTLRQIGLEEDVAKTLSEIYSVEVDTKAEEPTMLVYHTQPHDESSWYAEITMIGSEDVVKEALRKMAEALKEEDDNLFNIEREVIEKLVDLFDPESVCEKNDDVETIFVSGPCSVNYTIP